MRLHPRPTAGFSLIELVVACTLIAIVMTAVYTSFGGAIRAWRVGEAGMRTYQSTRVALAVMTQELQSIVPGTGHLFLGEEDEFEFYTVSPPMNVEEGEEPQLLHVRYRLKREAGRRTVLLREEAPVESALPAVAPGETADVADTVKLGHEETFSLVSGVEGFEVAYYWLPAADDTPNRTEGPPPPVEYVVREENREGWGLPQALRIRLTVEDPNAEEDQTTFTTFVTFQGPTTLPDGRGGSGGPGA